MQNQAVPANAVTLGDLCCSPVLQSELGQTDAELLAGALKALADPARLRILSLIRTAEGGRTTTGALVDALGLAQSTVTHHVLALYEEGFLNREPEGRVTWYSVDTDCMEAIRQLLDPHTAATNPT